MPKEIDIFEGGAGIGNISIDLYNEGYLNYCGLDRAKSKEKVAYIIWDKLGIKANYRFLTGDVHDIPLEDETFDIVGMMDFSYFPNIKYRKVIEEGIRILKPNGIFMMDIIDDYHEVFRLIKKGEPRPSGLQPIRKYTEKEINELINPLVLLDKTYVQEGQGGKFMITAQKV